VSAKALFDRLMSILVKPRPAVQVGDYYGPRPRTELADPVTEPVVAPAPPGTVLL
jgi:hypothetical protein